MKNIILSLALLATALAAQGQSWTNSPPHFWTPFSGEWGLLDGRMVTQTFGQENWIWAGNPPLVTQGDLDAELKLEFANVPNDDVGRHGGIMFLASVAAHRFATAMNGYTIDWIDRLDDHGFRLFRWDNGLFFPLAAGATNLADPPKLWQLEVRGDVIRFRADGQLVLEVLDATYRQGHFGIWAHGWAGVPSLNVQKLLVDDVKVGPTFHDNFDPPPTLDMQRLGNNVVLNWTNAAFALQSAPNVSGTFTNVPGATSPYTNPISGGKQFFRLSLSGGCSSGISGLLAHEPFDYAAGSALDTMNGGTGFSGPWSSTIAGPNYLIADGSLNFSPLCLSGGRLTSATGHTQMARALASDFGADGSTRYFSFLLRPEGVLNGGDFGGFHGLVLQGGPRLFIGKNRRRCA